MYTLNQYTKDAIALSKSLVIKFRDAAKPINDGLLANSYIKSVPTSKLEWKYYMNLAGLKHSSNNDVQISVIELGEKKSLTKELLTQYSSTRDELLVNGSFYTELLEEYPYDINYIHGCMYPVDIETAISAEDGTILAYNETLVEDGEYMLIQELEKYIKNFLARWHVVTYSIVDELYFPALLGVLYVNLPTAIMNIRNSKVLTNEVHSFHLEHFFRSRLNLWENISVVNNKTKYWLYKNLPYLIHHTGKEGTLQSVIENILSANAIGIGEYKLRLKNPELIENATIYEPAYTNNEATLHLTALNSYFTTSDNTSYDIESIVNKEIDLVNPQLSTDTTTNLEDRENESAHIVGDVENTIKSMFRDNQKTKMLEIETYQLFKTYGIDLFKLILDNWIYLYSTGKANYTIEYTDPNNNAIYTLTQRQAILLALKFILNLVGADNINVSKVNFDVVLTPNIDAIETAFTLLFPDGYTELLKEDLTSYYSGTSQICGNVDDMTTIIENTIDYFTYIWLLDSNSENMFVSGNIKRLMQLLTINAGYDIVNDAYISDTEENKLLLNANSVTTIDDLLYTENISYTIKDEYNIYDSLVELIYVATGKNINTYEGLTTIADSFRAIVDKLTSYTIQVVTGDVGESTILAYYNNLNVLISKNPLMTLTDLYLIPLEQVKTELNVLADNFKENVEPIVDQWYEVKTAVRAEVPFTGMMYIYPDEDIITLTPQFRVEVLKDLYYGYDGDYQNEFTLKVLKARIEPFENIEFDINGYAYSDIDAIDKIDIYSEVDSDAIAYTVPTAEITKVYIDVNTNEIIDVIRPVFSVRPVEELLELNYVDDDYYKVNYTLKVLKARVSTLESTITTSSGKAFSNIDAIDKVYTYSETDTDGIASAKDIVDISDLIVDVKVSEVVDSSEPTVVVEPNDDY